MKREISHFSLEEKIGGGGMGVVYKAIDKGLERIVALKLLPPHLSVEKTAQDRFMAEARAAGSLNHPNICTIYEVGTTSDDQAFIAMEYIDGESLQQLIERGPVDVDTALSVVIDMLKGLHAAHEHGIIHRDIKPANVMISSGGVSKIVDFGLAKVADVNLTRSGTTVGTVAYMSPEQARGDGVDHRSDLWSCGAVLFEMLTGQRPFMGDYEQAVVYAIINQEARAPRSIREDIPEHVEHTVLRLLQKNPNERYATAEAVLRDLQLEVVPWGARAHDRRHLVARSSANNLRGWRGVVGIAVALLLAGAAYALFGRNSRGQAKLTFVNPTQITFASGVEDYPSFSPDGRQVAYSALGSGAWDIWIADVGGGKPLNRTADYEGIDWSPSWSPDGNQIAFWSEREDTGYFVMSALAGTPRKVSPGKYLLASIPRWSADGSRLAVATADELGHLVKIITLATGESTSIRLPDGAGSVQDLSWSPDERFFAYVDAASILSQVTQIRIVRLSDGKAIPVTDGETEVWSPAWSVDGRTLFFVSNRGGSLDLWSQSLLDDGMPFGEPIPLTTGVGMTRIAFSADGSTLAYARGRNVTNLWRVPLLKNRLSGWADAEQLTYDQANVEFADVSSDGQRLVVSSDRGGNLDLWTMSVEGGEMQALTVHPAHDWGPKWSPDGQDVVFYSYRTGNRDIWVQPVDGGAPRQIAPSPAEDLYPIFSPDRKQVAFASLRGGNYDIWVVPESGGEPSRLTQHPDSDYQPQWSPDGSEIVFVSDRSGSARLWKLALDGGEPEPLTSGPAHNPAWSKDGWIYFRSYGERGENIWRVSADGSTEEPVTDFVGKRGSINWESLTTDGSFVFFPWVESNSDIWVMNVARER